MSFHPDDEPGIHYGMALWDAGVLTGDVCCHAYQLGACVHTESFDESYELDEVETVPVPKAETSGFKCNMIDCNMDALLDSYLCTEHDW